MRLESQIIEDKLVEGFDALEENLIKLDEIDKFIKRIRNESKKIYATNYLNFLKGDSGEPEIPSALSFLEAQAVRTKLQTLAEGIIFEAPIKAKGWTQASVAKFGKTIGKSPQEHGFFDTCVTRMEGKKGFDNDKAKRFCASIKDASYGSAFWRGKDKKKKDIEKDVKEKPFPKSKQLKKGKLKEDINELDKAAKKMKLRNKLSEAMNIKCSRCGKVFKGKDEYDAEMKFNMHKCKGKRDLSKMPMDLLRKVAQGKMKEEDAWKMVDRGKK